MTIENINIEKSIASIQKEIKDDKTLSPSIIKSIDLWVMGKEKENLEIYAKSTDAYNARDIEGCLQYWADDLKVIALPENKTVFSGKQEVREHLKKKLPIKKKFQRSKYLTQRLTALISMLWKKKVVLLNPVLGRNSNSLNLLYFLKKIK